MPPMFEFTTNRKAFTGAIKLEINLIRSSRDKAMRDSSLEAQQGYRKEIIAKFVARQNGGGNSRRAANAIRRKVYINPPRSGGGDSVKAQIYSKLGRRVPGEGFIDYIPPHITGKTIRPVRAKYLYIPISKSARDRRRVRQVAGVNNISIIPSKKGDRFYIVKKTRRRTNLIAILVKVTRLKPVLKFGSIIQRWERLFVSQWERELEKSA